MTSAMLAAKAGRADQLKVFEKYMNGETVAFKNHQGRDFEATHDPEVFTRDRADKKIKLDPNAVFLDAASHEEVELVEELLESGVDPNVTTADGLSALHQAAIEASIKMATLLIQKGANANCIDNDWWTPLHAAAACDHWRIVNLLLANGANTDVVNVDGDLPLEIAEGDKAKQLILSEMEGIGLDEEARGRIRGRNELVFTAKVNRWIADGVDLNFRGPSNETPLHIAAANGWAEACKALCDAGAKLNSQDEDGDTPLHLAAFFEEYKIVEILGEAGAKTGAMNRFMQTPLVMSDDATMIRLLKAIATNQKIKREETQGRMSRGRSGSSVKRLSTADKLSATKADARRMQEEALQYAKAHPRNSVEYSAADEDASGGAAESGKVVYDQGAAGDDGGAAASAGAAPQDLYAVPQKMGSSPAPSGGGEAAAEGTAPAGDGAAASKAEKKADTKKKGKKSKEDTLQSKKDRKKSKREKKKGGTLEAHEKNGSCVVC